ncbi:RpiB/LacA/LacB family sugar-phosphate isomerase [Celeribacter indicus]|uniref:Ribose-5-phosphate isomerase B n=1 Tax=Celeribacter indicus TaxID=1208324 RepID=A0A0B5E0G9_9RHOB|nr:RpiB/LacA/LacB family sugar-phosphate isomerase [Celeribacter indicus]AJE48744.1 ribose-5-phosphate isomerase B [Celeribacter indicus]SDX11618.1 ribose 5-phosphate isomerase B [Celeribacter indicus]
MRIAIGCDHAGFPAKHTVLEILNSLGMEPRDCGTDSTEPVDFPVMTRKVCQLVTGGEADRALLICGTGVGAVMAANRIRGIRAFVGHDAYSAAQGVEHDNANVMCLGAWIVGPAVMRHSITAFLAAEFSTEEHFRRRVAMLSAMEHD